MTNQRTVRLAFRRLGPTLLLAALTVSPGFAQGAANTHPGSTDKKETSMHVAKGSFDVKVAPVALDGPEPNPLFGRYALDKTLRGGFEGTGKGQMLSAGATNQTSGAYVAIERLEGTLDGRRGSFALAHRASMTSAGHELDIRVVPDSGTGDLAGIAGSFKIIIEPGGKHFYEFEYTL
jgi:hypothetical protein